MHLVRIKADGEFILGEHVGKAIPRYAILSHTWGADQEEVTFKDLVEGTGRNKAGYRKLILCGKQAAKDGLQHFWLDTCCIDKSSSAELSEAINSMFSWYYKAVKCYVYLSDVSISDFAENGRCFQQSRWFTRGWTLQELVAPTCVEFFSSEGERIGDKSSMVQEIQDITGIPNEALQGTPLSHFSISERMAWAKTRETKREEDAAYCLLGIFDIHMPLIYGEGREKAKTRLQNKINKNFHDQLSARSSPTQSMVPLKRKHRPLSTQSRERDPGLLGRSDSAGIHSAHMEALRSIENSEDIGSESRLAFSGFDSGELRSKDTANMPDLANESNEKNHTPWSKNEDLEEGFKAILSYARNIVDADERPGSSLRIDPKAIDGVCTDTSGQLADNTKDKNIALFLRSVKDELDGASRRSETFAHQVEIFHDATNTFSSTNPPINLMPHPWKQLTDLGEYIKDERIHDRIGYANFHEVSQFLLDIKHRARLESQNIANGWLDVTKFNDRYNVLQHYDKQVSSRLEGTCEWVFSHSAYRAWISEEHHEQSARILWICAPAGYGKTVLCARIVEYLKSTQSMPVAYFFASPHAQSGGEPSFIIRSWISQIAQLDSNALDIVRRHSEAGQRASESAIWSLFASIVSEQREYTFILDGFDEYSRLEDARTEFLQKLKESTKRTASRILITSRDETDINVELSPKMTEGHAMLQCRITNEDVRHDISQFSKSVVDKKLPNKDDRLRQDLAGQLTEKCEGMFLWIKLQQDQLRSGKNAKQLQNIVRNMPIGLEKTYERNWKTIRSHSLEEQNRALAILRWTTFALRPLTVSEVTEALIVEPSVDGTTLQWDELPDRIDYEYINSEIIDICGALVEIRAEKPGDEAGFRTIHLIHPSVREFLLAALQQSAESVPQDSLASDSTRIQAEHHEYLTKVCLGYLDCDDIWQRPTAQEVQELKRSFTNYAAKHWSSHIAAAGKDNASLIGLVKEFFRPDNKNFDQWRNYIETSETIGDDSQDEDRETATPLYYAALFNLPTIMEHIWAKDTTKLNKVGGKYGTPLQAVCFKGHNEAFELLLNWGANPNVQGGAFGVPINAAITGGHRSMVADLMRKGVNYALQDSIGRTPLYNAAIRGDSKVVQWLLEASTTQDITDRDGWTPLNVAAYSGHSEVVKLLLEKESDVNIVNNHGWTPFHAAACNGHLDVFKLLLGKTADIATTTDNKNETPLHIAARNGHPKIVELLLEKGSDASVADNDGRTPLRGAARSGHLDVVKLLLEKGSDVSIADKEGWTPLTLATHGGHLEIVKLLLEKEADIALADGEGWTPFHHAVRKGYFKISKLLLDKRAGTTVVTNEGWTPLDLATYSGHLDVVKLLLEKEADVSRPMKNGWTPLHLAADNGNHEVVRLLLGKGADTSVVSTEGWMPLDLAAYSGHLEVVKLLLEKEANILRANKNGWTPIHQAASNGHLEVVKLLLEKGADITIATNYGLTPLQAAGRHGNPEVIKLLLEKGADVSCLDVQYGTFLNLLAFKGHTDILRLVYQQYHANLNLMDHYSRTLLQFAARGGRLETFVYLINQGIDPMTVDAKGDDLLCYASSGGSLQVLNAVLSILSKSSLRGRHWSPLHWACRAGNLDVIEKLVKEGHHSEFVSISQPEGQWSPLSIAIFHGNEEMLGNLSASSRSQLGTESNAVRLRGERYGKYTCDGCLHGIYGPRFHCRKCADLDYCFMCKPFLESLHTNHEWDYFESQTSAPEHKDTS